ncbi:MAG: protein-disulfide reductase DsbD family protein [Pelagimonas sp.]|jgi:DsbC/DsbD-like thiol-disulfide interchange protein|nr:protein-disulfide reductase DsbD family protein [Pelagimonas sp.]
MTRISALFAAALALAMPALPQSAQAENFDDAIQAELRPGWRLPDGDHMAALHLTLAPGWKTYWRAPGDAGIPPRFDWRGNGAGQVQVMWPTPHVFYQSDMRSIGYEGDVILPIRVSPRRDGQNITLRGTVDLGICKDICLPHSISVSAQLPAKAGKPDPMIAAAMVDMPLTRSEAQVGKMRCDIRAAKDGLRLTARIDMPRMGGGAPETVIETADPQIWVAQPQAYWQDGQLVAHTQMAHAEGSVFALDRSGVRVTVFGRGQAVDIQGCDS